MSSKFIEKEESRVVVINRLYQLMDKYQVSAIQMANHLRLSKSAFYRILMGDSVGYPPYLLTLIEYAEAFPPIGEISNKPNCYREPPDWFPSS